MRAVKIMAKELIIIIIILGTALGLLSFGVGYSLGRKRALVDPKHDYIMSAYYLVLLKELEEKKYDTVKNGIAMMARNHVRNCRAYEKTLSIKQHEEIKKKITGYELIDNAEQLCGSLELGNDTNLNSNLGIINDKN